MALIKWTPTRSFLTPFSLGSFGDEMDRFFDSLFRKHLDGISFPMENWVPAFDVIENDKEYIVRVEVPGMDKADLQVTVKDGVMTISGEKKIEKSDKDNNYLRRESAYGRFSRSFYLADNIKEKNIKADYKNGVLTVTAPKNKNVNSKHYEIEIN